MILSGFLKLFIKWRLIYWSVRIQEFIKGNLVLSLVCFLLYCKIIDLLICLVLFKNWTGQKCLNIMESVFLTFLDKIRRFSDLFFNLRIALFGLRKLQIFHSLLQKEKLFSELFGFLQDNRSNQLRDSLAGEILELSFALYSTYCRNSRDCMDWWFKLLFIFII